MKKKHCDCYSYNKNELVISRRLEDCNWINAGKLIDFIIDFIDG